jgi:HAD superfamily hydrolase (TIGR01509 family)
LTETFAPQALVFDMDGLLLDTERIALDTFDIACRAHGIVVEKEIYYLCIGSTGAATREILQRALGPDFPYEAISNDWSELYRARVSTQAVDLKDGALALLELVRGRRLPIALATSTRTALATTKLRLAGLDGYFSAIIGGDAVARGKPDPEPYLAATTALGVAPDRCWAIEDSDNGVRSAHAAGLYVLQVPDLVQPSAAVRGLGHVIVNSLYDVAALLA